MTGIVGWAKRSVPTNCDDRIDGGHGAECAFAHPTKPKAVIDKHEFAFSRHRLPEACLNILPPGGSRECRRRAAPAVSCARLCEKAHTSIQVQRRHSGIPCAMALRLMARSPRRRIRLVTVAAGSTVRRSGWIASTTGSLTPATGAGTTRFCRTQRPVSANRLRPKLDFGASRRLCRAQRRSSCTL
jgi:hypothetical protein